MEGFTTAHLARKQRQAEDPESAHPKTLYPVLVYRGKRGRPLTIGCLIAHFARVPIHYFYAYAYAPATWPPVCRSEFSEKAGSGRAVRGPVC